MPRYSFYVKVPARVMSSMKATVLYYEIIFFIVLELAVIIFVGAGVATIDREPSLGRWYFILGIRIQVAVILGLFIQVIVLVAYLEMADVYKMFKARVKHRDTIN